MASKALLNNSHERNMLMKTLNFINLNAMKRYKCYGKIVNIMTTIIIEH